MSTVVCWHRTLQLLLAAGASLAAAGLEAPAAVLLLAAAGPGMTGPGATGRGVTGAVALPAEASAALSVGPG